MARLQREPQRALLVEDRRVRIARAGSGIGYSVTSPVFGSSLPM